eukprot:TRINITY_DN1112_c1_g1_i1.p1 TRINITY_DN1112_c1_g1~~TRINITY_DN1112_c1_g1_i1.p1  ORF type:complete len:452 (-),score=128.34 TRINITY_DN1112_c1_g1_i1:385-1740(-)
MITTTIYPAMETDAREAAGADTPNSSPHKKPGPEDYEWGQILGEGSFGDVVLATEKKTGRKVAVKKMLKKHVANEKNHKTVMNERNVLSKCNHTNIVKLFSAFRDDEYFYYVLNLAENGEVLAQIRKFKGLHMSCVKFWVAEVVSALEYLHTMVGVIHRDLKPENLLLDNTWHILITDFGTSKIVPLEEGAQPRKGSFVGTAEYVPPELVKSTQSCFASDLWSLGCIIYQMLAARPPFRGKTEYVTFNKIEEGIKGVVYPEPFSPVARDLIEKLLQHDPLQRLGAQSYEDLKNHPFFEGIDWKNLATATPPPVCGPDQKMVWQEDVEKEEQERLEQERKKLHEKWSAFLNNGETILETGVIIKKRKLTRKKRFLILTDTPRLLYIDEKLMKFKGEVPWDPENIKVDVRNDVAFRIIVPKRIYEMEDMRRDANRWKDAIEKLVAQNNGKEQK